MSVLLKLKQFQPNTNKKTYFSVFACRPTPNAAQRWRSALASTRAPVFWIMSLKTSFKYV